MLTTVQSNGLELCRAAAAAVGHPWPGVAAAEAAVETATAAGWFTSTNYTVHCNALGIKPWLTYVGAVFEVPTDEFVPAGDKVPRSWVNPRNARPMVRNGVGGTMWRIDAEFIHFHTLKACFDLQLRILRGPRYGDAMQAKTAEAFAIAVSAVWATNPARGEMVSSIYRAHLDVLEA